MAKTLLEWSGDQDLWTRDSLRRVAAASDYAVSDDDLVAIRKNVIAAARLSEELVEGESLDRGHLGISSNETRRTAILQLGPVENIDRLAPNQQLRFAPAGITLVYGENGSGKSGYTRIAKRLCRSLAADDLRGNVFAESGNARKVTVRYKVGDDEPIALEWDPQTDAPGVLQQISVFDSGNARLYVDTKNRVAYLPKEIAILEHHGEICQRLSQGFATDERTSLTRISVPFSTGYSPGSSVTAMLARLDPARTDLPIADELNTLAELSDAERGELVDLERELAADPMAMAAARRRMVALLGRIDEVLVGSRRHCPMILRSSLPPPEQPALRRIKRFGCQQWRGLPTSRSRTLGRMRGESSSRLRERSPFRLAIKQMTVCLRSKVISAYYARNRLARRAHPGLVASMTSSAARLLAWRRRRERGLKKHSAA
ncbi:hypothetical protein [Rhizobium laguerreae]|uniref:hypothetical protein n=1 Tax=Rhizobium laguerreae TaxID=1076926 RepID=UPI001C91C6CC|nr:hypothetical protein [Rhizobium laguerreae]